MSLSYAFFCDGRASGIPIALWASHYRQGTLERCFELEFKPIQEAYVACVQVSEGRASVAPRPEHIRYGRTNDVGWVVRREREALGAPDEAIAGGYAPVDDPPPTWFLQTHPVVFRVQEEYADRTLLYGLPNERYRIFWCYDAELFDQFATELEADPARALDEWGAGHHMMEPYGTPSPFGGIGLMGAWEQGAVRRILFPGEQRGYHAGWYFKDRITPAIFDATPEPFRALFAAEWLQWCCERVVHDDADWPYLWSLASVIRAANGGAPIPDLAKDLPIGGEMGKRAAEMRAYVYECAKRGIRRREYIANAVNIGVGSAGDGPSGWRRAGSTIKELTSGLVHPASAQEEHLDQFFFTEATKTALVAYFDMYALGFDQDEDAEPIAAHADHVRAALAWVRERQRALLTSFRHDELVRELSLHVPASDRKQRLELHDRYQFQAANAEVHFWEVAHAALTGRDDWKKLSRYLIWLGESSDLLSEMFAGLLEHSISMYKLSAESVEALIGYLYRYHLTLEGHRAEHVLPHTKATLRLEYDASTNRAVAKLYRGARESLLGEYEILTRVSSAPIGEANAPLGSTDSRSGLKLFRRALRRGKVRELVFSQRSLDVPHEDVLAGFPKFLAGAGALIKAGLAIHELVQEAKQKKLGDVELDLYLEVAEESLQALDPAADILQSVFAKVGMGSARVAAHPFVRGGAALAKVGTVIEASRLLVAGTQTLHALIAPTRSSADLAQYLDRGETVAAWYEGTKGLVQVASGAAGFGTLALGAGTTVAAIPLSAWVAVGLVTVATLNVLIYAETGGGSPVDGYLRALREARRSQFRLSNDGRILMPGEAIVLGEVDPHSGSLGSTASCGMARKLGALNELAKHARVAGARA